MRSFWNSNMSLPPELQAKLKDSSRPARSFYNKTLTNGERRPTAIMRNSDKKKARGTSSCE